MKIINKTIEKNIKKILSIFFILQPILDVIAAISLNYFKTEITLSSITRFIFLIFCIYYIIIINKQKKNIIYILLVILYLICFSIITLIKKDSNILIYELKNTINTFYLPIILLALINMFKQYKIKTNIKNYIYIFIIYEIFIIIPNITHTSFASYAYSKTGNIGWFLSANSVGNILSLLLPLITYYIIIEKKHNTLKIGILIATIYIFLTIGTKTPLLSLIICIITTSIYYIKKWIKNKKYKKIITTSIITTILIFTSLIVIPKTSFYKNIQIHKDFLGIKNNFEIFKNYELLDHFVFSQRLTFLNTTSKNYNKADMIQKLFGIGFVENYGTDKVNIKNIEMDYFDILYKNGIIGFTLFTYIILTQTKKSEIKNKLLKLELKISILLIILLSFFTGHILNSPSASIFVALILINYQGGLNEKIN